MLNKNREREREKERERERERGREKNERLLRIEVGGCGEDKNWFCTRLLGVVVAAARVVEKKTRARYFLTIISGSQHKSNFTMIDLLKTVSQNSCI